MSTALELFVGERAAWRADAACAGMSPAPWFPVRGESAEVALRVCAGCSVRIACLESALAEERHAGITPVGIRGGASARERRRLRRQRDAAEVVRRDPAAATQRPLRALKPAGRFPRPPRYDMNVAVEGLTAGEIATARDAS